MNGNNSNEIKQNISFKFYCKICDYGTCRKSNMDHHMLSAKHTKSMNSNEIKQIKQKTSTQYVCEICEKKYKDYSGLWRHKKKCSPETFIYEKKEEDENLSDKKLIMELLKSNNELQKQMIELCKEKNVVMNNSHNTTNNNNFNLNFFLNEQCKDALNIMDFVNTIKLQLSDLDMIGRLGYTEGMSKIFIRNLKELDIFKRPIHCSDLKRETLYVKDKDSWEKENDENFKKKQAIKGIENKNIKQLPQWRAENPTAEDTDTKKHLEYQHILIESMGGSTLEDDDKKHNKIVRNVAKEVVIDKNVEK